jgi:predicted AlkP superfamily pyrophosphatase or phosphodiesterase
VRSAARARECCNGKAELVLWHGTVSKMANKSKMLVVQVAGLGYDLAQRHGLHCCELSFQPMETVFPAVTCPVQASFRTASLPAAHGVVSNGMYDRVLRRTSFWEQSSALVSGPRIWDDFRKRGRTVAMLFWQQSLGESADIILSPAPIHKHHGGMIEDCYSKPAGLYPRLCREVGRPFRLLHYWGPFASAKSSQWIADATAALLQMPDVAPDLCLTYLPVLDYDLQRHGLDHPSATRAMQALQKQLDQLADAADRAGYELVVFGDYAIAPCDQGAIFPNQILREAGLFTTRSVNGMAYPDFHQSRAFALCDHEMAHVYVRHPADRPLVQALFASVPGLRVLDADAQTQAGVRHASAGELVLLADEGFWLAYPWWQDRSEAPEYAGHVDIHSKPGYDPCELFIGWPPGSVSLDPARICGSHGRADATRKTCWASSVLSGSISNLVELANHVKQWMKDA